MHPTRQVDEMAPSVADVPESSFSVRRPTIHDVAREAGVSYGTVSRYLNGRKWVGAGSTAAIAEAIDRVGYRANRFARSLKTGRSSTIAFLLTGPQDALFVDPTYAVLLRETTAALADRGLSLVLMTASTAFERERSMEFITGGHVDGVLVVSSLEADPIVLDLLAAGVPTVACGRPIDGGSTLSSVGADDFLGGRTAVEHLIACGRTRIATIAGPMTIPGAEDRLLGYTAALASAGMDTGAELVVRGDWSHESGLLGAAELLRRGRFDGVFAANDAMASGALAALRTHGLRVPTDVSIVGFDDTGLAATQDPPLTTLRQPFAAISREMVRLLCEPIGEPVQLHLPTELILRESSLPTSR